MAKNLTNPSSSHVTTTACFKARAVRIATGTASLSGHFVDVICIPLGHSSNHLYNRWLSVASNAMTRLRSRLASRWLMCVIGHTPRRPDDRLCRSIRSIRIVNSARSDLHVHTRWSSNGEMPWRATLSASSVHCRVRRSPSVLVLRSVRYHPFVRERNSCGLLFRDIPLVGFAIGTLAHRCDARRPRVSTAETRVNRQAQFHIIGKLIIRKIMLVNSFFSA